MKVKVKVAGTYVLIDVCDRDCPARACFWPRPDPGIFTQGQGYRTRLNSKGKIDWICGTREIGGCPSVGSCLNCRTCFPEGRKICTWCGQELHLGGKKGQEQVKIDME